MRQGQTRWVFGLLEQTVTAGDFEQLVHYALKPAASCSVLHRLQTWKAVFDTKSILTIANLNAIAALTAGVVSAVAIFQSPCWPEELVAS